MTLRHRLLLVYLIVALLSVATLGVAIYELNRTQNIYGPLLIWHDVVWDGQRLKDTFASDQEPDEQQLVDFENLLMGVQQKIGSVSNYIDQVDYIRDWYIIQLRQAYQEWKDAPAGLRTEKARLVSQCLDNLDDALKAVNTRLMEGVEQQQTNKLALSSIVLGMAVLHILLVGWLLRRWLLEPMERLNRQVQALGRDQPPPEPLLTSPLEMARLASALDQARQSLQVYRQKLIDNERLTTIGQFAAQLAHNLRNPLASIRAVAQMTGRHERGNEYLQERVSEIIASVDRLNHWIGGVMEVARRDPTPARAADVIPLLHRIGETLRPELAAKELQFKVEAPLDGVSCIHDPATLEQALVAMVVNAIEASPLGESILLRVETICSPLSTGGPMLAELAGVASSDRACRISVNDSGPGLPVDQPERIFEFSYSTKQRGMGLGLALARLALERQGGQAHARNNPAGGAIVYVDLPLVETPADSTAGQASPEINPGGTVLVSR